MRLLLTFTAAIEAGTGLGLLAAPSRIAELLFGAKLDDAAALTVARVAGVALLALAIACWLARDHGRALVVAMLFYNVAAAVLAHAGLSFALSGAALWPAVWLHTLMAGWCAFSCKPIPPRQLPSHS